MQCFASFLLYKQLSFGAICNKTNSHDSQIYEIIQFSLLFYFGNQKMYKKNNTRLSVKGIRSKLIFLTQSSTVQSFNLKIRFQLQPDSPWKPEDNLKLSHQLRWLFRRKKHTKEI